MGNAYGQRRQTASAHEGRPMAGTAAFLAKGKLCQGVTCLSSNKAGLFRTPESFNPGQAVCKVCQLSEPEPVKPAAKPPPRPVVKPAPIAKPGQGVTAEKAATAGCSACGTKWDKHDGLAKTCAKLKKAREALAIIYTWAKFKDKPDLFDRAEVLGLCGRTLAEIKPPFH